MSPSINLDIKRDKDLAYFAGRIEGALPALLAEGLALILRSPPLGSFDPQLQAALGLSQGCRRQRQGTHEREGRRPDSRALDQTLMATSKKREQALDSWGGVI